MSNINLNSDGFERAAHSLVSSLEQFSRNNISHDVDRLERYAEQFANSVHILVEAIGMQAENDQRKALGHSMAYTEFDFLSLLK